MTASCPKIALKSVLPRFFTCVFCMCLHHYCCVSGVLFCNEVNHFCLSATLRIITWTMDLNKHSVASNQNLYLSNYVLSYSNAGLFAAWWLFCLSYYDFEMHRIFFIVYKFESWWCGQKFCSLWAIFQKKLSPINADYMEKKKRCFRKFEIEIRNAIKKKHTTLECCRQSLFGPTPMRMREMRNRRKTSNSAYKLCAQRVGFDCSCSFRMCWCVQSQ